MHLHEKALNFLGGGGLSKIETTFGSSTGIGIFWEFILETDASGIGVGAILA